VSPDARLAAFKNAIAGQYLIDTEAGRGGMAVVYVARDVRLGRRVAVKVLTPGAASPAAVTAFRREIDHTLRLEHPNILPLLDVGEAAGLPYYVMRFVRGGSLRTRLGRQGRLSLRETAHIVQQTAAALRYAHGQRILHCDVKPENILLEGDHVYLADFGISRVVRLDASGWGLRVAVDAGTSSYVSPEQALGEGTIDERTDLYSLACVAYEMLAGRAPFEGATDREIMARRFTNPVVATDALPGAVPGFIRAEMARALALEPRDRHPSVAAFAAAFDRLSLDARPGAMRRVYAASAVLATRIRLLFIRSSTTTVPSRGPP
jgi:serine/threonine-protein kinase